MCFAVSLPWVVRDVLGHLLVCVEADLVHACSLGLCIGKAEEGSPDSGALRFWKDGNIVDVKVVLFRPQHDEPYELVVEGGNVDNPTFDQVRVVIEHGGWWLAHSRDIGGVGRFDTGAHTRLIGSHCLADLDSRGGSHAPDTTPGPAAHPSGRR